MSSTASASTTMIIGLSGPSSSGKTTLARLLRQIFNVSLTQDHSSASSGIKLFILHEDDFYKTDKDIPLKEISSPPSPFGNRTLQDWDCVESLDLPLLSSTLRHIKAHGCLPPSLVSKEDQNTVGDSGVENEVVERYHSEIKSWVSSTLQSTSTSTSTSTNHESTSVTICLLDGFLLYPDPTSPPGSLKHELVSLMRETLDARFFIPSTRAQTIQRRNARKGYVTMEGFWEDPEGYVEDVVWPNFGVDHGWLFGGKGGESGEAGDGEVWKAIDEGRVDEGVARGNGILVGPGRGEVHLREILPWAVERVREAVEGRMVR